MYTEPLLKPSLCGCLQCQQIW